MLSLLLLPLVQAAAVPANKSITIHLDTSTQYQEVDGFGCSQAFSRAEDILGLYGLSEKNQSYVLDLMFDVNKGAGLTILRNDIGSNNSTAPKAMNTIVRRTSSRLPRALTLAGAHRSWIAQCDGAVCVGQVQYWAVSLVAASRPTGSAVHLRGRVVRSLVHEDQPYVDTCLVT
jgi:hypothetical protein